MTAIDSPLTHIFPPTLQVVQSLNQNDAIVFLWINCPFAYFMFIKYWLTYGNYPKWTGSRQHHFKLCGLLAECGVNSRRSSSKCSLDGQLGYRLVHCSIGAFLQMSPVGSTLLGFASHWFFIFLHFLSFYSAIRTGLLAFGFPFHVLFVLHRNVLFYCFAWVKTLAPVTASLQLEQWRTLCNRAQEAGGSLAWRQVGKLLCEEWNFTKYVPTELYFDGGLCNLLVCMFVVVCGPYCRL